MPLFSRGLFWILGVYVLGSAVVYWLTGRYAFGERVLWLPGRMTGPIYTSMWLACCFALALPTWLSQRRWLELFRRRAAGCVLHGLCAAEPLGALAWLIGGLVGGWLALHRARYLLWLGFVCALLAMLTLLSRARCPRWQARARRCRSF